MHFLLGAAGLLALVAMAYGEGAAVVLARVIIVGGLILLAIVTVCVMTGQFKGL